MNFKSSLCSGAAVIAAMAMAAGAAQAAETVAAPKAPAKHAVKHKAMSATPATPAASAAEVEALRATVSALQARLDQVAAQSAKTAEDTEALETAQDSIATSVVAQSNAINTMPATIQKDTLGALPKTLDWAKNTSVSGRMYFDFSNIEQKTNGLKVPVTGTGFDIKRFYVGVDHKFNDIFSANVTMDARYQSTTNDVQWYIKKAYLQAKVNDMLTLRAGAADMPWIPFVEDLYGYRFIDKTITENRATFANSADWGIHAMGKFGDHINYAVSVVDGAGYRNPSRTSGVDVEGRVNVHFETELGEVTGAIGGYSGKLGKETEGATNVYHTAERFDVLLALVGKNYRLGGEYFTATNWNSVTTAYVAPYASHLNGDKAEGTSVWGSYNFTPMVSAFGKVEYLQPNKDVVTPYAKKKDTFFNVGVNFEPVKIVDLALVYKRAKTDANNAPTLVPVSASYDEVGLFGQFRW